MRRIHHQKVHAAFRQRRRPVRRVRRNPDGRPHAQAPVFVLAGVGILALFVEVLEGNEALQVAVGVHYGQFFDLVLLQKRFRLLQRRAHGGRNEVVSCHHFPKQGPSVGRKTQVAIRNDAHQPPFGVHDGNASDAVSLHHGAGVRHRAFRMQGDRVEDHAAFGAFYAARFVCLPLDGHVFVQYPGAAFPRDRNGHFGLGNRVHGGGQEGNIQANAGRERRFQGNVPGHDGRMPGHKQHVVVRKPLLANPFEKQLVVGGHGILHCMCTWRFSRRISKGCKRLHFPIRTPLAVSPA